MPTQMSLHAHTHARAHVYTQFCTRMSQAGAMARAAGSTVAAARGGTACYTQTAQMGSAGRSQNLITASVTSLAKCVRARGRGRGLQLRNTESQQSFQLCRRLFGLLPAKLIDCWLTDWQPSTCALEHVPAWLSSILAHPESFAAHTARQA